MKGVKGSSTTSSLEAYQSVKKWKEGLSSNTYTAYVYLFEDFMKWLALNSPELGSHTPDELVRRQKQSRRSDEEDTTGSISPSWMRRDSKSSSWQK